jgi:hypothetical protein
VPGEGSPSDVPPAAFDRYQVLQQSDDERMAGSAGPTVPDKQLTAGHQMATGRPVTSFSATAMALTFAAGIALGAMAGYASGSAHARRLERLMANAPAPVARVYTDATVEPAASSPVLPAPVRVERAPTKTPERRAEPARRAALIVLSRPSGASVTIDGRRVGATPVTMQAVDAGTYVVRIQRPGYRPWITRVQVAEGARARVAASLVGGYAKE